MPNEPAGEIPPPVLVLVCPRCGGDASERRTSEYALFPCTACGGVWVDNTVSQRLVRRFEVEAVAIAEEVARVATERVDARATVVCPICKVDLQRVTLDIGPTIELDVCGEHGTWFDRKELPHVARRLTLPAPEPVVLRTSPNTLFENIVNASSNALDALAEAAREAGEEERRDADAGPSVLRWLFAEND
jgi:Zn-finger nucleic acid-binding protein